MATLKTTRTKATVTGYLAARANPEQRADCKALMAMFRRITGQPPKMWGPSIVGYGSYTYRYDTGYTGTICLTGFAIRGRDLVVYLDVSDPKQRALLRKVGKHEMGKSCFYFRRLADLDVKALEALVRGSIAATKKRHTVHSGA